jgi:hypothetical protein
MATPGENTMLPRGSELPGADLLEAESKEVADKCWNETYLAREKIAEFLGGA